MVFDINFNDTTIPGETYMQLCTCCNTQEFTKRVLKSKEPIQSNR